VSASWPYQRGSENRSILPPLRLVSTAPIMSAAARIHRRVRESRLCPGKLQCRHGSTGFDDLTLLPLHCRCVSFSQSPGTTKSFQSRFNNAVSLETIQDAIALEKGSILRGRTIYGDGDLVPTRNTQLSEISGTGFASIWYRGRSYRYYYRQATGTISLQPVLPRDA